MTTVEHIPICPFAPAASGTAVLSEEFRLGPMREAHIGLAVTLISRAMNPDEGGYAAQTLHLHFASRKTGIDDGRILYSLTRGGGVVGTVGLHHYAWGPPENVWLSWFALDPALHGRGLAAQMLDAVTAEARRQHFMKFFIETYATPEFARARSFYRSRGFAETGGIPGWLPDGGAMVVYYKDLTTCV